MKTLTHWSRVPIRKPLLLGFGCPEGFGSGPAFHRCGKPFGPPSRRDNGALMTGHCDSIGAACNLEVGSLAVDSALNSVHRRSLSRYRVCWWLRFRPARRRFFGSFFFATMHEF
jgi:hypothetical protein